MTKIGRKVSCNFDKNIKCILLVRGKKQCIFEETSQVQRNKDEIQLGICALLPQSEREKLMDAMKEERLSNFRTWKD